MARKDRLNIITGTDRSPLVRLRNPKTGDPLNLTGTSKIQVVFDTRNRGKLTLDDTEVPAVKAQYQDSDLSLTIIADNAGSEGNNIILQFDGVNDLDTIIGDWNAANVANTASHNGTGTEVLTPQQIRLTDGYDAYYPVEIYGDAQLGKIVIRLLEKDTNLLKRGPNQDFVAIIDYGSHPGGTRVKGFYSKLDVIDD